MNPYGLSARAFAAILLLTVLSSRLVAQLTTGFVSGIVVDPSGAVILGARVSITNAATNTRMTTATNEKGVYRIVAVEAGTYSVEFVSPGFETVSLEDVVVGPAREVVLNQEMPLPGQQISIDVQEGSPLVGLAKASPTIDRTFDRRTVQALPMSSAAREVSRLALAAPLIVRAPGSSEISANGQRARQNNFMVDGTDNNDLAVTVPIARVIPEAVAEFQVQATPYSAEFGRNTGAQISILTRSGTNVLHGEAWDYFRANWLESLSLLNKRAGFKETPRFIQNQAGGSLGGALKQDRLFAFALGEFNRRRDAPDARNGQTVTIPTQAGFASLSTVPLGPNQSAGSRQAMMDVLSFLPEVYQETGALQAVPLQLVNGVPIEMGSTRIPVANPSDQFVSLFRLDNQLAETDTLSYRFLIDKRVDSNVTGNRQFGTRFAASSDFLSQSHAFGFTHTSASNWVNQLRFAYVRSVADFPENDPVSPTVMVSNFFTVGGATSFPQGKTSNVYQVQDVFTYLRGRHSIKFGIDLRRNQFDNRTTFDAKGTWFFQNLSEFLNNEATVFRQSGVNPSFEAQQTNQFYFVQDDIKVSQELNINLGIRHELSGVPFGFFGAATPEIAAGGVPPPTRRDVNNLAPRFGFAYSPSPESGWWRRIVGPQQTVFRGGFGIVYDVIFYNVLTLTAMNYPRNVPIDVFQPDTINLFPAAPPRQTVIPPFDPTTSFINTPVDTQNPTTHFWSLSIQRQLGSHYLFETGYSGNRSYHLLRLGERNPGILTPEQAEQVRNSGSPQAAPPLPQRRLNPSWGSRLTIESTALSEYHAAFLRLEQKTRRGMLFGVDYMWSASHSDNDEALAIGEIVLSSPHAPQDFFDYRSEWSRSVFDRPHRLSFYYLFQLPNYQGGGALARHIASGWQIGGFTEWQSGQPFTVRTGVDSGGSGFSFGWRPDYNPNGRIALDPTTADFRTFSTPNRDVFLTPLTADGGPLANSMPRGGNLGRNTFRGPGFSNWNLTVSKSTPITERISAELRADFFNLWNHRNFGNPVATMNSAGFGTNTSDPGGRSMLAAIKLRF
jgi:hypothetical protein